MRRHALTLTGLLLAACAGDLRDDFPFDGELPDGVYVTTEQRDGVDFTRVDASHKEAWVYVDLDTLEYVPAPEAAGSSRWELAFQRFKVLSNSGVSGSGSVATALVSGGAFEALGEAPAAEYLQDRADGSDENGDVDSPFLLGDGWYSYSLLVHKVSARDVLYVVRTSEGKYRKLQFLEYYDEAGTAAQILFRSTEVPPPAGPTP